MKGSAVPAVPATSLQLGILLAFVLPGAVYQFTRSRLRGPSPDDTNAFARALRALGVSALLLAIYLVIFGKSAIAWLKWATKNGSHFTGGNVDWRLLGVWALILLFGVPWSAALGFHFLGPIFGRLPMVPKLSYDPTPGAWDFAFTNRTAGYVRILTKDGTYLGGWFGEESFASSYPEPLGIYLEAANRMDENGVFGEEVDGSGGMYVRCDDIVVLEFLRGSEEEK